MCAQLPSATNTLGTPHMGTTVMDLNSFENCFACFIQFETLVELSETICDHIVNEVYEWFEFRALGKSLYQIGGDVTLLVMSKGFGAKTHLMRQTKTS